MARTRSIQFPNTLPELIPLLDKIQRALLDKLLNSGGLAIKAGSSALAKTVNAIYFQIGDKIYTLAAGDMAALSGTVLTTKYNVFVFTVNSAGTLATRMGTEAATLGGLTFPTIPDGEVVIGFVIIHPTGTGSFVGGTTALDDGTVVPNAVYANTPLVFHPEINTL
jgi:hypothetical protein